MKLGTNVHHVSGHCEKDFQCHLFKDQGHAATSAERDIVNSIARS